VVLLATVKGDVHDIGKNIVGVVLGCNNYRVIDMGVMVPWEKILEKADEEKVDIIGLSGLITPSLDEMVTVAMQMKKKNLKVPLLIGGATTSKMHTAVKIAPEYENGVVHVLDASRSVCVVGNLINQKNKPAYLGDLKEEYTELRKDYYDSQEEKTFFELEKTRKMKLPVDFVKEPPVCRPKVLGSFVWWDYPIQEVIPYIDWTPFFHLYQLRGKYPNRDFPALFKDERVGEQAEKLFEEAKQFLQELIDKKLLKLSAAIGIWPCNSKGDDMVVYTDESRKEVAGTFYGLRQQQDQGQDVALCLSDFVAPHPDRPNGAPDYIGGFACTAGIGSKEQVAKYEEKHEVDKSILLEAVADRLAEAFAEVIHLKMRKELWGFAPDENLSLEELLKVKYQGIRPAPGYPSQPDHREKETLWQLLQADKSGMTLTDSFMMQPAASVSALVFTHPKSEYFSVGQVALDQIKDYAARRGEGTSRAETERWLGSNLGYDPKKAK